MRPMFHFMRRCIEAHICFVALKVYKELERMLKVSDIKMNIDKVLALAKTGSVSLSVSEASSFKPVDLR